MSSFADTGAEERGPDLGASLINLSVAADNLIAAKVLIGCFWRNEIGGGTQDKKMSKAFRQFDSKGHLPRVVYHQAYNVY